MDPHSACIQHLVAGRAHAVREAAMADDGGPYRGRLTAFFQEHNPSRLAEVDGILRKYAGKEEELLASLAQAVAVQSRASSSSAGASRQNATPSPSAQIGGNSFSPIRFFNV